MIEHEPRYWPTRVGPPTPGSQVALLSSLRSALDPLVAAHRLPATYELQPGLRLRRAYGQCRIVAGLARITVRCTADDDRGRWRRVGAIVATLLHELAHLRHRGHGPRFWALHRRLLDAAAAAGVYDPEDHDPSERGRGLEKLAGSAAGPAAAAARMARRVRQRGERAHVLRWQPGAMARLALKRGPLAGAVVRVVAQGHTRLVVQAADGRRYRVPPGLLARLSAS